MDEWLSVEQVCQRRCVSAALVRAWCKNGTVTARKRGTAWSILASSVPRPYVPGEDSDDTPEDFGGEYLHIEPYRPVKEW